MIGAGNNATNLLSGGAQAAASAVVLPKHLDFSFRDKHDATAKRRYQVKVPCRLMAVLALVFLVVPGFVFLHKELHIHDDHHESHFKAEKYVNVDTKHVWDTFRLATTNQTQTQTAGAGIEETMSQQQTTQDEEKEDHASGGASSELLSYPKAMESVVVVKNQTIDHHNHDLTEGENSGDKGDERKPAHDDSLGLNISPSTDEHEHHEILSSSTVTTSPNATTISGSNDNTKVPANSTSNEISDR